MTRKQHTIKLEGAAAEAPPTKQQKASDALEWDDEAGEGDAFNSLEHQLGVEFAGVWAVWMVGVEGGRDMGCAVSTRPEQGAV
jgi:hypothetical protein